MSTPLVVNGVTYQYPQQGDKNWGPTLNTWSQAVTLGMLQKAGGSFPLTAETDFGASFGLKVLLLKSQEANIAATGFLRLGNASAGLVWRNAANNADLALTVNASNQLTFNGTSIGATTSLTDTHILVGNASNQPADVAMSGDATISRAGVLTIANGVITTAKLATPVAVAAGGTNSATPLVNGRIMCSDAGAIKEGSAVTPSMAIVTDTAGFPATGGATATEISRLSGLSSNAQTQLTARLQLAGGTMSGALNMGSNAITNVPAATATGQPVTYEQIPAGTMWTFAGSAAPTGWLIANGSAISRTTFATLFAAIGTAFGAGDGSTTFNIPNMVNSVAVGAGSLAALGSSVGAQTNTFGIPSDSISHYHQLPIYEDSSAGSGAVGWVNPHRSAFGFDSTSGSQTLFGGTGPTGGVTAAFVAKSQTVTVPHTHGGNTSAGSVVQPSVGLNYIIKT